MKELEYKNDWEYHKYYVENQRVDPKSIKEVTICGKKYKTIVKKVSVPYSDMGHAYTAESDHLFLIIEEPFGDLSVDIARIKRVMHKNTRIKVEHYNIK